MGKQEIARIGAEIRVGLAILGIDLRVETQKKAEK